ncbi:hypothetical protein J3Q64DRAFT_1826545 [Phycomyces blakesleeanus]|uniref:Uncharacterized protein n=1 Tax=Phycomyces blakesleeanus TaxID=4837 RepID=A0ABR3AGS4_PHYBL
MIAHQVISVCLNNVISMNWMKIQKNGSDKEVSSNKCELGSEHSSFTSDNTYNPNSPSYFGDNLNTRSYILHSNEIDILENEDKKQQKMYDCSSSLDERL